MACLVNTYLEDMLSYLTSLKRGNLTVSEACCCIIPILETKSTLIFVFETKIAYLRPFNRLTDVDETLLNIYVV